jgi:hypothetical protein
MSQILSRLSVAKCCLILFLDLTRLLVVSDAQKRPRNHGYSCCQSKNTCLLHNHRREAAQSNSGAPRYILPCIYNLELPLPDYPASDYGYDDESMALDEISKGRETISESPFYCPGADYAYVQSTPYADARTMDLLKDIRDYYIVLEHEEQATTKLDKELVIVRRLALRARILDYESAPSANSGIRKRVEKDYVYESIRLTSLSLIHFSDTCLPIRAAFTFSATVFSGTDLSVKEKWLKPLQLDTPSSKQPVQRASLITSPQPSLKIEEKLKLSSEDIYNLR